MQAVSWIAVVLIFLSALVVTAHFSSTTLEFSRYNTEWNGTSELFSRLEAAGAVHAPDLAALPSSENAVLFIIAPAAPVDTAACGAFLGAGSTILIADETGSANSLLFGIGSTMRIVPGNLSSLDREYDDPRSVVGYSAGADPLTEGVATIVTNHPAAVSGGDAVITTSVLSWMDEDGDGLLADGEVTERFGLLSRESVGGGTVYVLSDPSIVINGMVGTRFSRDNDILISRMLSLAPVVIVEQSSSRTAAEDGVLPWLNLVRNTTIIKISVLLVLISALVAVYYRKHL
ncbi:MAG: DUF4350 domain-containing protein [Methanomicrobiaceae archaeon]|nr:DUF4350 domain-containing protein [Methanomicrobiaceae archaeon]